MWTDRDVIGTTTWTAKNLKAMTKYSYYIEAIDESGNKTPYLDPKTNATFRLTTKDTTPPTVRDKAVSVTYLASNEFTIKWTAASDNATQSNKIVYRIYWKPANNYNGTYSYKDVIGVTQSKITGLKANTMYYYYVKASDESGNYTQYLDGRNAFKTTTMSPGFSQSFSY